MSGNSRWGILRNVPVAGLKARSGSSRVGAAGPAQQIFPGLALDNLGDLEENLVCIRCTHENPFAVQ
jgi:hypothetical protein